MVLGTDGDGRGRDGKGGLGDYDSHLHAVSPVSTIFIENRKLK